MGIWINGLIFNSGLSGEQYGLDDRGEMKGISTTGRLYELVRQYCQQAELGFAYRDAEVAAVMQDVNPVLVINSKADALTPYFMGKDIYNAVSENKGEIWTVDDSKHFEIWVDYNQEYRKRMDDFLTKYE